MVWPNQAKSDGGGKKWPDWNNPQPELDVRCQKERSQGWVPRRLA